MKLMENTIAEQWELLSANVIPDDAPIIQRVEMKRAFYAGAAAVLDLHYIIGDTKYSEDAAIAMIDGWQDECVCFAHQMESGAT